MLLCYTKHLFSGNRMIFSSLLFIILDTVAMDTSASLANSLIVMEILTSFSSQVFLSVSIQKDGKICKQRKKFYLALPVNDMKQ